MAAAAAAAAPVAVRVPVSHLDPPQLQQAKAGAMQQVGLGETDFPVPAAAGEGAALELPGALLGRLRCVCMTDTEFYWWDPAEGPPRGAVSVWNELKALKLFRTLCADQLPAGSPQLQAAESAAARWAAQLASARRGVERAVPVGGGPPPQAAAEWWAAAGPQFGALLAAHLAAGGPPPPVAPCLFPDTTGRGLVFCEPVAPPRPVVAIPGSMLVTAAAARVSGLAPALAALPEEGVPALDDDTALLLFIVRGRFQPGAAAADCGGRWESFFALLPDRFNSPLFWEWSDLAELQGTPLLEETLQVRESIRQCHAELFASPRAARLPHLLDPGVFSYEHLLWARAACDSRAFVINVDGRPTTCLCPLADLINHTTGPGHVSYRRFDQPTQSVVLDSLAPCSPGEQALMNYGPMSNGELLLQYGFVLDGNPQESCQLGVELSDEDELLGAKQGAAAALALPEEHFLGAGAAEPGGRPGHRLLLALAVAACESESEIAELVRTARGGGGFDALPEDLRSRARSLLCDVLGFMLSEYPSTLEEDLAQLQQLSTGQQGGAHCEVLATPNAELALRYRIGQKTLLTQALAWASPHA
eukprot:TRINITY_DN50227_c0_g1_i1.p1 TRINITY_DN50227_c0_g1~~TRINITY_DN50227_c0_g1_i1.p1  ORF type:complete len:615 (+),score=199.25 TRINITY_DN50227_c0_g1_i1:78-1847(+)